MPFSSSDQLLARRMTQLTPQTSKKQDDVLPQRGTQGLPVALKQHVDQRHKVEHQRFAEDLEGRKGVQMLFGHRHGASSARA